MGAVEIDRELQFERAALAKADRHINAGELRLCEQQLRVTALRDRGQNSELAESLLEQLESTLVEWQRHRGLIQARIAHLERKRLNFQD